MEPGAVRTEPIDKWVRAYVDDVVVVDSRDPLLFWEERFPVPSYAFPTSDVRTDLLTPTDAEPPTQPWFFLPQGPVAEWYDLTVGERRIPHAAWVRDAPEVSDRLVLTWQRGAIDRWTEEDEVVAGHPRDPHKRVEAIASSRHVVIERDGVLLADSRSPVLLFETDLPTRYYVSIEDVNRDALEPTSRRTHCPYKGFADRYWSVVGQPDATDIAWSYSDPKPAVGQVSGRISFYNELVDITLDGVPQPRPESPFNSKAHRTTS